MCGAVRIVAYRVAFAKKLEVWRAARRLATAVGQDVFDRGGRFREIGG